MAQPWSITKTAIMLIATLALVLPFAALNQQAAYATSTNKDVFRVAGTSASAVWETDKGNTFTDTVLSVVKTNYGTDIYVEIVTYGETDEDSSYYFGELFTTENVFTMDKKLNTASLDPVEVVLCDIYSYDCSEESSQTVTIQADWHGFGSVAKLKYKATYKLGDISVRFSANSLERSATAVGSINSEDLGDGAYGQLARFQQAEVIHFAPKL